MNLIKYAIERPVAVVSAVLLVVLFGLVALQTIPIQLAPDVNRPVITVSTKWRGAAPAEVEREIINPQEEKLAGLSGLRDITAKAQPGGGEIILEFGVGTQMDRALLLVANRLDQVASYPDEVEQPTLDAAGSEDNAIAWFIITRALGNDTPIHQHGDFVIDVIKERIERVAGVGQVNVFGGSEREIQVVIDPLALSRYQLTVSELVNALAAGNISLTAGNIDEGKRRYVVRAQGELSDLNVIRQVVVRGDGAAARVTLGDVAQVRFGYRQPGASIRLLGNASLAMNATRQTGANVIETMRGIKIAVNELNEFSVPNANLKLQQVYDETVYINSAIELVQQNIWVGGTLAALILLLFLRSLRATIVITLAIPVSIIGAFVAMAFLGRSLNVVSLAGLAFAVGMVVDAAIVVLENIYRHKESGRSAAKAAYLGANQVWGAVLVSALTTVMVFIPILIMQLEAGQLFRDIAVAISVSVILSLAVSITVIPALSKKLFSDDRSAVSEYLYKKITANYAQIKKENKIVTRVQDKIKFSLSWLDAKAALFATRISEFTARVVVDKKFALSVTLATTATAVLAAWMLLPKLEYLPEGNRNLLYGVIIPPPGYNLDTTTKIAQGIENQIRYLWEDGVDDSLPKIQRFFFVATRAQTFLGAVAEDPSRISELKPILSRPVFKEPGTFGFISQPSIFGRGIGGGRKIDVDISAPELDLALQVAGRAFAKVVQLFPREQGNEWQPVPGLELGAPEVRVVPHRLRLADSGISARDFARTLDAFNDGVRVTQATVDGKLMDIILMGERGGVDSTQGINNLPIVSPSGTIIPAAALADITLTNGPTEIRHRERVRTITLSIRPKQSIALEAAIEMLRAGVIDPLQQEGVPAGVKLRISGTADKLVETSEAMAVNLTLSLIIVFLVMAVLFESFIYPLIIMLAVPVAAAGGFIGLALLNLVAYQPLDMLTMLGFVILIGIVVNNAILLVHQTLHLIRYDKIAAAEAIRQATRNRIRPIFMSTLTSVFGMLPLVLFPGAGSELYRGLGSVVVGGLSLSAIITLLIVPPMLALIVAPVESRRLKNKS